MSERPYDADQLQKLTRHIEVHGPVIDAPALPDTKTVIGQVALDHHPGVIEETRTALSGLGRVFTASGRAEKAKARDEKASQRAAVVSHVADRIENPRRNDPEKDPLEKISWIGTHAREVEQEPKQKKKARAKQVPLTASTNFSDLGGTLFPSAKPKPTVENQLRPSTKSEIAADKRLWKQAMKKRRSQHESRWLHNSYPDSSMQRDRHTLSRAEKKHMRSVSKRIQKLDKKTERAQRKFEIARDTTNGAAYRLRAGKYTVQEVAGPPYKAIEGSARALGKEIADQNRESLDVTREQAKRLALITRAAGRLALHGVVVASTKIREGSEYLGKKAAPVADFYRQIGHDTAKFYWQAGKHVTKVAAKRTASTTIKAKSKLQSKKSHNNN